MKRRLLFTANALVVFALFLLLWKAIIWKFAVPVYMLPTPWKVAKTLVERFPDLCDSLQITASSAACGLLASMVVGVCIALLFARSPWFRSMFLPYTILLQTVPIVAIAPLIIMWVGPGFTAICVITFIICLAPIIANATQGLVSVDENLVQLFLMNNASQMQILRKLRLPPSLPYVFVGLRISAGIAVIGAITGELFAGSGQVGRGGLGYSILYAMQQLQTDYLFALVIAATVLGFAFFFIVMFFEWLALHKWHESAASNRTDA
jgi:NitT/TauT family transport system permease protein